MARKFLYLVAIAVILVIAGLFVLRIWSNELTRFAFVPRSVFEQQQPLDDNAYNDPAMWFSRPGLGTGDPARWQPAMAEQDRAGLPTPSDPAPAPPPAFAVFYIHPTSYLATSHWNAPLDDVESQDRAHNLIHLTASPFNAAREIWVPRYRQAAFGAFLTDTPDGDKALDAAYADVEQAFAFFLSSIDRDTPIVLAGHSQGALHLLRLLREHVKGTPEAGRIAAAYAVGWPVSLSHDLPELGLQPCAQPDQSGCIASWMSFAEPADPGLALAKFSETSGFDGKPRGEEAILCFNPLTGTTGGTADAGLNRGTLVPDLLMKSGTLRPAMVPARCDSRGLLLIGQPPEMGNLVFPGNNYHVYDIPLFWENLRLDTIRRVNAWAGGH